MSWRRLGDEESCTGLGYPRSGIGLGPEPPSNQNGIPLMLSSAELKLEPIRHQVNNYF